jgi:hypothetical protein
MGPGRGRVPICIRRYTHTHTCVYIYTYIHIYIYIYMYIWYMFIGAARHVRRALPRMGPGRGRVPKTLMFCAVNLCGKSSLVPDTLSGATGFSMRLWLRRLPHTCFTPNIRTQLFGHLRTTYDAHTRDWVQEEVVSLKHCTGGCADLLVHFFGTDKYGLRT